MRWIVAVPSYKRPDVLQKKTLTTLHDGKVPADRVYVFVANKEQEAEYKASLDHSYYNKIVVGIVGLAAQRQFISDYFPKDELILFMDDDITKLIHRVNDKKAVTITDLVPMIDRGFETMKKEGAHIWGVYAAANPFYMSAGYTTKLRFLIGAFYGIINTKKPAYKLKYGDNQEDKERTLRYWVEDKKLVRFNDVAPKTVIYAPGGMTADVPDRIKRTKEGTEKIIKEFPEYVRQTYKKASSTYDLLFRTGKIAGGGGAEEDEEEDTGIRELPIRNEAKYEEAKERLLEALRAATLPKIGKPAAAATEKQKSKGFSRVTGRADVIGSIGRTVTFGYGMRKFKGYGEFAPNKKYPELLKCLAEFGNRVVPKGWTYEAITLNEGVKAKKHKDNKNSGDSVIIGIGDFSGGDIKVWDAEDKNGKAFVLHDQPLMFNGATHYHQTTPFKGERYTMIFYKQKKPGKTRGVPMKGAGPTMEEDDEDVSGGIFA
jgi:hypothetical protein